MLTMFTTLGVARLAASLYDRMLAVRLPFEMPVSRSAVSPDSAALARVGCVAASSFGLAGIGSDALVEAAAGDRAGIVGTLAWRCSFCASRSGRHSGSQ